MLSDLIIPADESGPSASEAGVPEFLDDWIAFRTEQDGNQNFRAEILGGLMWLDHESKQALQQGFRRMRAWMSRSRFWTGLLIRTRLPATIIQGRRSSASSEA